MNIILIPGLWLDASSWDAVADRLQTSGHQVRALTLPGTGADGDVTTGIGMADWVGAVVDEIDASEAPVALVGHSGGGNVAWGATDKRPDKVAHLVLVDTVPPPPGGAISEFPIVDGVVPFPGWSSFDESEVYDLDEATRHRVADAALSVPMRVPTDAVELLDERRYQVPVTILSGSMDEETFRAVFSQWEDYNREFTAIARTEVVRIDTGHWPQFSQPERLADAILAAIA